jgi:hypothetical protein
MKSYEYTAKDVARFWSKVEKTDSCWLWKAAKHSAGYGVIRFGRAPGVLLYAHRVAYELVKGPIPEGLHLDHLCRVVRCCNPAHLEAVPAKVNALRGISPAAENAKKTHCSNGHPFEGQSLYLRPDTGGRQCLVCKHEYWKHWYEKNKEKVAARSKAKAMGSLQRIC